MSKFLLLLGPSGTGKSTIVSSLLKLDDRFTYISPYMTRSLRDGEKDKVKVSKQQMDEMLENGDLLAVNELFGGVCYGTPRLPITQALSEGNFPILDWPISRLDIMREAFPDQLFIVYILPPSIDVLCHRLDRDGRDVDGERLKSALNELDKYKSFEYDGLCDMEIISEEDETLEVAMSIYSQYLESSQSKT